MSPDTAGGAPSSAEREGDATVVVASFRAPELLAACLDSLSPEVATRPAPVVVARPGDGSDVESVVSSRPWVRRVEADPDADVPRLRGAGLAAAGPGWVALTEDHCLAEPDWLERLLSAATGGVAAVGGGMGNARAGLREWGAFFSEYGFFSAARPPETGAPALTGANVIYAPGVRERVAAWMADGDWEDVVHGRLAAEGATLRFEPRAGILQNATYRFAAFCRDRYEHGRDYARVRVTPPTHESRWMRLLSSLLLPPLLTARVARAAGPTAPGAFLAALPFTLAFLSAWAVGEAMGYLKGPRP